MSLTTLLNVYAGLESSAIKSGLRDAVRSVGIEDQAKLVSEIDEAVGQGRLSAYHYSFALRVSQSLTWAIHCFKTRHELPILSAAVAVTAFNLEARTNDSLAQLGGVDGLVAFISDKLPFSYGQQLFKELSKSVPSTVVTSVIDSLLAATFIFYQSSRPKPLERFALCMINSILASSSASSVRLILPRVVQLVSTHQWERLVNRYPVLISEFILAQIGVKSEHVDWSGHVRLERSSWLTPSISLLLHNDQTVSESFFRQFLHAYAKYTVENLPCDAQYDLLGRSKNRVTAINLYLHQYFKKYSDRVLMVKEVLSVLSVLETLNVCEGRVAWDWVDISNVLRVLVEEFSRNPKLWDSVLEPNIPEHDILLGLLRVFRGLTPGLITITTMTKSLDLLKQPRGARFPLLYLAFSTIGIRLDAVPDSSSISSFPTCPLVVLSSLAAEHCVKFLDVGIRTKGQSFLQNGISSSSQMARALSAALRLSSSLETSKQHDARLSIIRAACEGARRGPAGDTAPEADSFTSVIDDVTSYVRLASRTQDDIVRLRYALLALSLCVVSQSPGHFLDTLQAMLGHYAKDPVVGPGIFNFVVGECSEFLTGPACLYLGPQAAKLCSQTVLRRWIEQSSLILSTLLGSVKISTFNATTSPKLHYDEFGRLLSTLLSRRIALLRLYQPTIIPSVTDAISLLLDPWRSIFLAWEKLKVIDQPETFGFTSRNCVPKKICTVQVESRHSYAVLSYMCDFGEDRMQLYREGRRVFWFRFDGEPGLDSGTYSLLPVTLSFIAPSSAFLAGFQAPRTLKEYCEDVLFLLWDEAMSPALSTDNRWYFHTSQFESALSDYLFYSKDVSEVVDKIIRLFEHYPEDHVFLILRHPTVCRLVWTQPRLHKYIELWFPDSLWMQNGKTGDAFLDIRAAFVITPLRWFPKRPFVKRGSHVTLLEARNSIIKDDEIGNVLLAPFMGSEHFSGYGGFDLPMKTLQRLAALGICWALTTCTTSREVSSRSRDGDSVNLAIEGALVDPTSMSVFRLARLASPLAILPLTLSSLHDDDLSYLVTTLLSIQDSPIAQTLAFDCTRQVRVYRPHLVHNRLVEVLDQSHLSDWHRQVACLSSMRHLPHGQIVQTFLELERFAETRAREERARPKPSTKEGSREAADPADEPLIKVTTVKMLVDLLGEAMICGVLSTDKITSLEALEKTMPHISVKTRIVSILKDIVLREDMLSSNSLNSAFNALLSYVEIGSRLSESRYISDAEWNEIANDGTKNMPEIDTEHPIAMQLLITELERFTHAVADRFARLIIEPCVVGQMQNRTNWLRSAMLREGGISDIHATYDTEFDCPQIFYRCRRHLRHASSGDVVYSGLLQFIHQRAIMFLDRTPYEELIRLVRLNHPTDWQTSSYGKTIASLCAVATADESSAFTYAIRALVDAVISGDLAADLYDTVRSVLLNIGERLLLPNNVAAFFQPPPSRSKVPFYPVGSFLEQIDIEEERPGTWVSHIRPIAERLLVLAQENVAKMREPSHNAEALYAIHIFRLQLLLLPHPGYRPYSDDPLRHAKWVSEITPLLSDVVALPNPQRYLSDPFSTFFQTCSGRIPASDAFELIKLLFVKIETNTALQIARIELAIRLCSIYWQTIQSSTSARAQYDAIRQELLSSDDGILRVASFTM